MGVKIRQRDDGAWWLFVDHQGHRKAKKIGVGKGAKQLAEAAAIKIRAKLLDGDLGVFEPAPDAPTFAEVYQEWVAKHAALRAVGPTTLENYRSFAERHLLPAFGRHTITSIDVASIESFIETKRAGGSVRWAGKPLADNCLKAGLRILGLILKRAVRRGLIPATPMANVEWRSAPRGESVDPFTSAELRAILSAAERVVPDFATMLRLWAQSGCRAGEVSGLQWQDLDLAAGTIKVRRTWSRQRLGPTKTRRERDVSILHPIADDTPEWRPGATSAARGVIQGLRRLPARLGGVHLPAQRAAVVPDGSGPHLAALPARGRRPVPRARNAAAHLGLDHALPQRAALVCPAPGRVAVRGGAPANLRALATATIRNPGATGARPRLRQRPPLAARGARGGLVFLGV
jgi:integrase